MASSMGSIMMNWTYELVKQAKRKNRKKKSNNNDKNTDSDLEQQQHQSHILEHFNSSVTCIDCETFRDRITNLEEDLEELLIEQEDLKLKLEASKKSHANTIQHEHELREQNETIVVEKAQIVYELEQMSKNLQDQIRRMELEHQNELKRMEELRTSSEFEWSVKVQGLENELRNAIYSNVENANFASMSRAQLEQEITSLQTVADLRNREIQDMRQMNFSLNQKLEKFYWMEKELNKARQRVEEMNMVVQNKMVAEKELIDMTEGLTNDLTNARSEILSLRREIENRQYLHQNCHQINTNNKEKSVIDESNHQQKQIQFHHKNHHQKIFG